MTSEHRAPGNPSGIDSPATTVRPDGLITIGVDEPSQLFDRLDQSAGRRHLDRQIDRLIVHFAQERRAARYLLSIHIRDSAKMPEDAAAVATAVQAHFEHRARETAANLRDLISNGKRDLVVGVLFLAVCGALGLLAGTLLPSNIARLVEEGFVIIGWVALWRPVDLFLYDLRPLRRERNLLNDLSTMTIRLESP